MEGRYRQGREDEAAEDIKGWERGHSRNGNSAARRVWHICTDISIFVHKRSWCAVEATTHKHAHIHTKHHLKIYSFRRRVKEGKSISLAKISLHSSLLSLIHLLIPLFLVISFQCSQSLFLPMGEWCLVGDYGKVPHLFIHLHLVLGFA